MTTRTMNFAKDGHHYIFRYRLDMQDELIDHISDLAASDEYNIDWLDAATLSFQVAQHAATAHDDVPTPSIHQK